ncbi:hypothetical protein BN903_130 [Halorubrum sp. AJ67]|nr:hypothetical protein BN903_130 [Halorubrum sp. AJ67]
MRRRARGGPHRTSRLPSLAVRALRALTALSRGALVGGFAAGCQRDLRSLPTRAVKRALGGARHRLLVVATMKRLNSMPRNSLS